MVYAHYFLPITIKEKWKEQEKAVFKNVIKRNIIEPIFLERFRYIYKFTFIEDTKLIVGSKILAGLNIFRIDNQKFLEIIETVKADILASVGTIEFICIVGYKSTRKVYVSSLYNLRN